MFDYHISRFDKKVADLSDQPALSPSALKEWFDSSPEELRQALNHICDDGQVLSAKVEGLILGTFEGAVSKSMFDAALTSELDAKATNASLSAAVSTLSEADEAIIDLIDNLIVHGSYQGNGQESQFINLGFTPRILLTTLSNGRISQGNFLYGGLALPNLPASVVSITENGFTVTGTSSPEMGNSSIYTYKFVALR